ncbi:MAG: efflux RND transporter periplasmic adaptor subunit [Planctomycetota bacterium]|nr:MAG: efflux RND transporter periplasmic adaptor subunit [Planctomycetota bacterium]
MMVCTPRLLVLTGLAVLAACSGQTDDSQDNDAAVERIALPVQVLEAGPGSIAQVVEAQARLRSTRHQELVILAPGIIRELHVMDGQVVEAGDPLLEMDPLPDDMDAVAEAENALRRAQRHLQRLEALQERISGAVAQSDIDQANDGVEDAQLQLTRAQRDRSNRQLVAPFHGVIEGVEVTIGQRLDRGTLFARIQDVASFTIHAKIPETVLPRLRTGLPVDVHPVGAEIAQGTIISLPAAVDRERGTGTLIVRVDEPGGDWRPGSFAVLRIHTERIEGDVVLPRGAVLQQRNRSYVWVVVADPEDPDHHYVDRRWLRLGRGDEDSVVIEDGLQAGDLVVRDGTSGLREQVPVRLHEQTYQPPPAEEKEEDETTSGRGGRPSS